MDSRTVPAFGTACVLAGGDGLRMRGADKLGLELRGERLLARLARSLSGRFADLVAVSNRPEALEGLGYRVVPDLFPGAGPAAGLHAGLLSASSRWVYLVACDMPGYSGSWIDGLVERVASSERAGGRPVAALGEEGGHLLPFHAMYERSLVPRLAAALSAGGRGPSLQGLLRSEDILRVHLGAYRGQGLFDSIDTPEDLAEAEARPSAARL